MTLVCINCAAPITRQSKSGRCRPCAFAALKADPVVQERRRAALRERMSDPDVSARVIAGVKRTHRRRMETDPEYVAKRRAQGRHFGTTWGAVGNAQRPKGSAERLAVGQKLSDQRLAWCPREYRPLYHYWRRNRAKGKDEARRLVEQKMRADRAELAAKRNTLEWQLEAVRRGAGLVEVRPIRRAEPTFTLTGNGSAACAEAAL